MAESLYEYPEIYDIYYADKAYAAESAFIIDQLTARCESPERLLVVGCGTGNHLGRLAEEGYEIVGVDSSEPMLDRAREKFPEIEFRHETFPYLDVTGQFDAVLFPYGVINYIPESDLRAGLDAIESLLTPDGVLVVDWIEPKGSAEVELTVRRTSDADYCFLTSINPLGPDETQFHHIVLTDRGGETTDKGVEMKILETRLQYHDELVPELESLGFDCEIHEGYGTDGWLDDEIVVCVAARTPAHSN